MATESSVSGELRLQSIRKQLAKTGSIDLAEAAAEFSVSEMTIRRDLQRLEQLGQARRVRGGAVQTSPARITDRRRRQTGAKAAIAEKLATLLPTRGAIALDASSTVLRVAQYLDRATGLYVLTNGPDTFAGLQGIPGVTAFSTGGELDPHGTGSLVGVLATRTAQEIITSRFFAGAAAINALMGTEESCLDEAQVKQAFAAVANETVLAVDSSKIKSSGVARGLPWDRLAFLVTELDPRDELLREFRKVVEVL
jgi:DeoR family transcriptional regulator, fructose operon transcriptional repressor